jgi:UDP-glucose 4-epimerase
MTNVLLTGGAGYIGSHICAAMTDSAIQPVILDNFSNSNLSVIPRIEKIVGRKIIFELGDVCDDAFVSLILEKYDIDAVIHLAAFKSVVESIEQPLKYYINNVGGMLSLLKAMESKKCNTLLFSSSAAVYGNQEILPIKEDAERSYTNPYGQSKIICEDFLEGLKKNNPSWKIGILRYFNPIGAHSSGLIGGNYEAIPDNLISHICHVAMRKLEFLKVYGGDYETNDGTGIRDYIHIEDLINGHIQGLKSLMQDGKSFTVNLGTGKGYSVLDIVKSFENINGVTVPYKIVGRRLGDIPKSFADPSLAKNIINWESKKTLENMCRDAWNWEKLNAKNNS